MTYISRYLPELGELKSQIEKNPDILSIYAKYMGFNGSSESIDYLIKKLSEFSKNN